MGGAAKNRRGIGFAAALIVSAISGFFAAAVPFGGELSAVSNLAVIVFALPALVALYRVVSPQKLWILLVLASFAILVEALSITTGFPYGFFTYGSKMGWRLGGLVPWTVPFAWVPLVVGAVAISAKVVPRGAARFVLAVLLLVFTDLLLDPVAVKLGFWSYTSPGSYFGVPLSNFIGWVVSGAIGVFLLNQMLRGKQMGNLATKGFIAILIFWSAAACTLGLYLPLLVGCALILFTWGTQEQQFRLF